MAGFSLSLAEDQHEPGDAQWAGASRIRGPRWSHLPVITVGLLGYQIFWSVEMSYGTHFFVPPSTSSRRFDAFFPASPYLLSLGLSKSLLAIVFLAGPLSGLLVQPVIGGLGYAYSFGTTSQAFLSLFVFRHSGRQM